MTITKKETNQLKYIEDNELVQQYLITNDEIYFTLLYERYFKEVYSICFSFAKDSETAHDLTQDIFERLLKNMRTFRQEGKFRAWLLTLTRYKCIDWLKVMNKLKFKSLDTIDVDKYNKQEDDADEYIKLQHAILHLSLEERQLIKLKYYKMCTITEISNDLNLSNSAIKMRLLRLRRKIQYLLLYMD